MIDEIFKVMKHFDRSYINQCGELILSDRGNVYFTATNCKTKEDVICKLLEWCSRPIAKGEPYATNKRNIEWRNSLLCGYNNYLGTNFSLDDMYWIYDKLGNAVNHELTLEFIHSNYDLSLVRPQKKTITPPEPTTKNNLEVLRESLVGRDILVGFKQGVDSIRALKEEQEDGNEL